jgi:hypothetical protein
MRVRLSRLRFTLTLFAIALSAGPAVATSVGKSAAPSPTACSVSGKFLEAKRVGEKIFWVFDQISGGTSTRCVNLGKTFEVLIPSGSYSTLAKSNVYPLSITEPSRGAEIDLHLEWIRFKSGESRWLIGGDADAFRVRR